MTHKRINFGAGGRLPLMPNLLRQCFDVTPYISPSHVLELSHGERARILAATIIYSDSSRDIVRAQRFAAAMTQLANLTRESI